MKRVILFLVLISLLILWSEDMKMNIAEKTVGAKPAGWTPEFTQLEEMKVVGMQSLLSNKLNLIAPLWERFMQKAEAVPNKMYKNVGVGISYGTEMVSDDPSKMEYRYFHVVGMPVTKVEELPEGMCWITVPAGEYAKFYHIGPLDNLMDIYSYIFQEWMPKSGYVYDTSRVDVEWYGEDFDYGKEESVMYIYVPVKKKEMMKE